MVTSKANAPLEDRMLPWSRSAASNSTDMLYLVNTESLATGQSSYWQLAPWRCTIYHDPYTTTVSIINLAIALDR